MSLPTVSKDVVHAVLAQWKDPAYKKAAVDRFVADNGILAGAAEFHIDNMLAEYGEHAAFTMRDMLVLQYLCLENQFEVQELEKAIG